MSFDDTKKNLSKYLEGDDLANAEAMMDTLKGTNDLIVSNLIRSHGVLDAEQAAHYRKKGSHVLENMSVLVDVNGKGLVVIADDGAILGGSAKPVSPSILLDLSKQAYASLVKVSNLGDDELKMVMGLLETAAENER